MRKLIFILSIPLIIQGCAAVVAGSAASSIMVAQDRRTAGTIVEDRSIQLKSLRAAQNVVEGDPHSRITAVSYNNRVLLLGQVPSRNIKAEIEDAVRSVDKVKVVNNEIVVSKPISGVTQSNDAWITTKIKSEMAVTKDFNPTRVKVATEDGVVYLMGLIKPQEEDIAVDIARYTKGVKKVVKIFEYEQV